MKSFVDVDGQWIKLEFARKKDFRFWRFIGKFFPAFLTHYWTTIGNVVYVPENALPDKVYDMHWMNRHGIIVRHEARHVRRAQRLTLPLYAVLYLGPSLTILLPAGLVALICAATGLIPWVVSHWIWCAFAGLLPLSVGFAIGRAWDESQAYAEQAHTFGPTELDRIAKLLWWPYLAVPPFIGRFLLRRAVSQFIPHSLNVRTR